MLLQFLLLLLLLLPAGLLAQRVEYHHLGNEYPVDGVMKGVLYQKQAEKIHELPKGGEYHFIVDEEGIDFSHFYPLEFYQIIEKAKIPVPFEGPPERAWTLVEPEFGPLQDTSKSVSSAYGNSDLDNAIALILWVKDGRVLRSHRVTTYEGGGTLFTIKSEASTPRSLIQRLSVYLPLEENEKDGFPVFAMVKDSRLIKRQGVVIPDAILAAAVGDLAGLREMTPEELAVTDSVGNTPLHRAALNGHPAVVQYLLEQGLRPDAINRHGQVPVMLAAAAGRREVLRVLADADPSTLTTIDKTGQGALYYATVAGSEASITYLLTTHKKLVRKHLDLPNNTGWSPIDWAINTSNDIIYTLLRDEKKSSLTLSRRIAFLEPTLFHVCRDGALNIAKDLVWAGAERKGKHARPYLVAAAQGGSREMIDYLLKKGVQINEADEAGVTPLIAATEANRPEVVRYLIEKGADLNSETETGFTALMTAVYSNQAEIARILIEARASVNEGSQATATLETALNWENRDMIKLLLEAGIMYRINPDNADPILEKAIRTDIPLLVHMALTAGVKPNHLLHGKYPLRWVMEYFNATTCVEEFAHLPVVEEPETVPAELLQKAPTAIDVSLEYPMSLPGDSDFIIKIQLLIDEGGHVQLPKIIESPYPDIHEEVLKAVTGWRFDPGRKDGTRVQTKALQSVMVKAPIGNDAIFEGTELPSPPQALQRTAPIYPLALLRNGITGNVSIEFVVDENGNVRNPNVMYSTHHLFSDAVLYAIQSWKFKPAVLNGRPVITRVHMNFPFGIR